MPHDKESDLLSVVVPVFDVEDYIEACLESLAAQTYGPLEVIIVDDGSTDSSGELVDKFAAGRSGWEVLHVPNGGLGRARNTGMDRASGKFIAFLDSDDILPPDAYESLVDLLLQTGSDLASGSVLRFDGARTFRSGLHRRAITETRLRTHVSRRPELLYDSTAWNKVYRTQFLKDHDLRFPEGVFYEDIPLTLPAHFLAESVDVLDQPVYLWRERQTATQSITQRRAETRNLVDRMAAVRHVDQFLTERGDVTGKKLHDSKVLKLDLPLFMDVLLQGDDEFRSTLVEVGGNYLRGVDPSVVRSLPAHRRLQYHLIQRGLVSELVTVARFLRQPARSGRVVRHGLRLYADLPFFDDPTVGVPREVYDVTRSQPLRTGVRDMSWEGDTLVVDGHAFIHRVPDAGRLSSLHRLQLRRVDDPEDRRVRVRASRVSRPDVTGRVKGAPVTYDGSGFRAAVPARLLRLGEGLDREEYELLVQVAAPAARRGSAVAYPNGQRGSHPRRHLIAPDQLAVPAYRRGKLRVGVFRVGVLVVGMQIDGDALVLTLRSVRPRSQWSYVHVQRTDAGTGVTVPLQEVDEGVLRARIPLAATRLLHGTASDHFGRLWVVDSDRELEPAEVQQSVDAEQAIEGDAHTRRGRPVLAAPLHLDPGADAVVVVSGRTLALVEQGLSGAVVESRPAAPRLDDLAWEEGGLTLSGPRHGNLADRLILSQGADQHVLQMEVQGDSWSVTIPAAGAPGSACLRWLAAGQWSLHVAHDEDTRPLLAIRTTSRAEGQLMTSGGAGGVVCWVRSTQQHASELVVDPGGDWRDRGAYNRRRHRLTTYRLARRLPLQDTILFLAWKGRQYSDSPRAIHQELVRRGDGRRMVWAVEDHGVEVPEGTETVLIGSADYYRVLGRARWIINNDSMPPNFAKRDASRYGQTWHGTPLKRIGFDIDNLQMANQNYLKQFRREVAKWDVLVSPNPFSTQVLTGAFQYQGPVLEIGYPRNDIFFHPEERARREAAARRRLNIPEGKQVVLYAPTWRDNQYNAQGQYVFPLKLDLERLHRELGESTIILIRGHQLVAQRVETVGFEGMVRNVSGYPEISDLYLIADVLITDYSSVMFDFAITGKPMLFYTYDLDSYRDELRGFYFDFEKDAPGPLLRHTSEVISALRDLPALQAQFAETYRDFRDRFTSLEDGGASARFIDGFFT